jgi:hypothetical protein
MTHGDLVTLDDLDERTRAAAHQRIPRVARSCQAAKPVRIGEAPVTESQLAWLQTGLTG